MQGSSRAAFAAGHAAFATALGSGDDVSALAEDLFAVTGALDSSASLRRALVDPSWNESARCGLVEALFGPKVSPRSTDLLKILVSQRWADDADLGDAIERMAVEAVVVVAELDGRLDTLEDDLFRFGRFVAADPALTDALSAQGGNENAKAALVEALLQGKASAGAIRLVRQAAIFPRGRRFGHVLEGYLAVAAKRREQVTATVTAAFVLDEAQMQRLAQALTGIYQRPVHVHLVVDHAVIGGIRIQVGDEVVDGTILRRIQEAERALLK